MVEMIHPISTFSASHHRQLGDLRDSELELAAKPLGTAALLSPAAHLFLNPVGTCLYWGPPHQLVAVSPPVQLCYGKAFLCVYFELAAW